VARVDRLPNVGSLNSPPGVGDVVIVVHVVAVDSAAPMYAVNRPARSSSAGSAEADLYEKSYDVFVTSASAFRVSATADDSGARSAVVPRPPIDHCPAA